MTGQQLHRTSPGLGLTRTKASEHPWQPIFRFLAGFNVDLYCNPWPQPKRLDHVPCLPQNLQNFTCRTELLPTLNMSKTRLQQAQVFSLAHYLKLLYCSYFIILKASWLKPLLSSLSSLFILYPLLLHVL